MQISDSFDRRTYIGSSDAASIIGVSPFKSQYKLYLEKIGEYSDDFPMEVKKRLARGKKFEPIILNMLVDELSDRGHEVKVLVRNERLRDQEYEFLASETDMVLEIDGEVISAEAKSINGFASKLWGEPETDEFPIYYQCQVMHDLMVKGRNKCVVAALIGTDDLRIHWINRDEEIIQAIRKKEIEFWNRVINREPPDPSTPFDIKALYPKDQGLVMDADDELASLCAELRGHKQTAKALEELIDELVTKIKLKMGDASVLMYQGKKIATWASNKDGQTTDWKSLAMSLNPSAELINQFTKAKQGARPFLIK